MAGADVTFFSTCLVDSLAGAVGRAAVRVLERQGHRVTVAAGATCCGQPAWNSGFAAEAARVARVTLGALEGGEGLVCLPSGSCATMIRVYWPQMFRLAGDPGAAARAEVLASRLVEFSELAARQPKPVAAETMVGMIMQMQGKNAEAQKQYEKVLAIDRSDAAVDGPQLFVTDLRLDRVVHGAIGQACFGGVTQTGQTDIDRRAVNE